MKVFRIFWIFGNMLDGFKEYLLNLSKVAKIRAENPGADIGFGVRVLGSAVRIKVGRGTCIDDGVVLDFRAAGELILGEHCSVRAGAILSPQGGVIKLGDGSGVNHYTILYGHGGLEVGSDVRFAAHGVVIPANHGISRCDLPITKQSLVKKGIKIGNDVWVGAGCTILDGVDISDGVVVGAGSVVTSDVESYVVVAGVPARVLRKRLP